MENYSSQVKAFIIENFLFGSYDGAIGEDDSFLENGVIDSTGILEIVAWIEETFAIKVDDMDLIPENFDSVRRLSCFIARNVATMKSS